MEERLRSLNSQRAMMLDDVKQAQLKEVEKSQASTAVQPAESVSTVDSTTGAVQSSPSNSLADTKAIDGGALEDIASQPEHSSPVSAPNLIQDDSELSAALSAIVDSEDLSGSLPTADAQPIESSITPSSPIPTAADIASLPCDVAEKEPVLEQPTVDSVVIPVSESTAVAPGPTDAPPPVDLLTPNPKPTEKKTKGKKSKEKTGKASRKKSKGGVVDSMPPVTMSPMQMAAHPQQSIAGMAHTPAAAPHQGMMPSQPVQPIAPHPTSQPIMFVPAQPGASMIIQQPGVAPHANMPAPMMMPAAGPGMSYQQAPMPASHPVMSMQPTLQPAMPSGNGQQVSAHTEGWDRLANGAVLF